MTRRAWLGLVCAAVAVGLVVYAVKRNKKNATTPITPGPDTTVIDGPLDAAGLIDYETALNEKLKGKSTPDTNAVVLLLAAIGPKPEGRELHPDVYEWLGCSPPPEDGEYLVSSSVHFREELQGDDSQALFDHEAELRNRPWMAADEPNYAAWLTANEKPLAVVAEASRRPDYFYPLIARDKDGARGSLIGALLPLAQRYREIASILSLRVTLRCGEKKFAAAWEDVLTMHRLARLLAQGGTLVERLVGAAIGQIARNSALRYLEAARPTARQALACREQLARLPAIPPMADAVATGERFVFLDAMQFLRRDRDQFKKYLDPRAFKDTPPEAIPSALARLQWDRVLRLGNRWYDRVAAALRQPTRGERTAALATVEADLVTVAKCDPNEMLESGTGDPFADRLTTLYLRSGVRVHETSDRQEVLFQTELLAFALAAYHADQKQYPAKLADLVPKYANSIPDDVNSGKPLIYKPTATGYDLYSVGPNGTDDDGQLPTDEPPGDDYGVRMPFVNRAPPPPDDDRP